MKKQEKEHLDTEERRVDRVWTYCLVLAISLARIGSGLFISIHGPTLLSLADNVNSDVAQVSWVFTSRSIGVLVGSVATGYIMRYAHNIYSFAVTSFILGIVVIATPWIMQLWLLAVVVMIGGITFGYLDAGMQALILQVWGEKESRPHINAYHFTIALGAFIAPLLCGPFLNQDDSTDSSEICPADSNEENNTATAIPMTTEAEAVNPIVWAYMICGVFMLTVGFFFVLLGCINLESKVRNNRGEVTEKRAEEPINAVWLFFIAVTGYYFFCVAAETAYQSYIYSVSVCSGLQFDSSKGTWVNAVYWAGFGSGRFIGIFVSQYLQPRTMIIGDFVGTITTMTIQSIWGEYHPGVTWTITFLYAFLQATLYPAGVSWSSQHTNMSGHYIFIFSCGQALGQIVLLPLGGYLFEIKPFSVMYMILVSTICNAIFFLFMVLERKFNSKSPRKECESSKIDENKKSTAL